jgi:RNA:NAD 2'-phosphotransferase (TPT1/KptA family)
VVEDVSLKDRGYALNLTELVHSIVVSGACNRIARREHVHFALRMHEPESTTRDDGDHIVIVVDARKVTDLINPAISRRAVL